MTAWLADRFVVIGGRTTKPCPPGAGCVPPERPAERDGAFLDPSTNRWAPIAPAPVPLAGQIPVIVRDKLYVLAGETGGTFLRYDPSVDRWERLPLPADSTCLLVAGDNAIFAITPSDEQGVRPDQRFDVEAETWHHLPDDPLGPSFDREATWFGGRLLLAAKDLVAEPGSDRPSLVRLAWWGPETGRWSPPTATEIIGWHPRSAGRRVVWPDPSTGDGGAAGNWGRPYPYGGVLDPAAGTWTALPSMPDRPGLVAPGLVVGSRVLVAADVDAEEARRGGHLLDPETGAWDVLSPLPGTERRAAAIAASEDTIFVWGGGNLGPQNLSDGYLLRI